MKINMEVNDWVNILKNKYLGVQTIHGNIYCIFGLSDKLIIDYGKTVTVCYHEPECFWNMQYGIPSSHGFINLPGPHYLLSQVAFERYLTV